MSQVVKVENLKDGFILSKDIYINSTVLFRSGTYITPALVAGLKEKGVRKVSVRETEIHLFKNLFIDEQEMSPHQLMTLNERFQNDMAVIASELRFGRILHSEASYKWLRSVYLRIFSNPTVVLLMNSLKQWDPIAYYHSVDVFVLCTLIFRRFHWEVPEGFIIGCLLHDIGKLYTPRSILLKTGKLTEREYQKIKEHTVEGCQLLSKLEFSDGARKMVRSHHERLNGSGYPDHYRVSEEDQDLKIMMIADVYSALTLDRSYRKPMHAAKAMQILLNDSQRGLFDLAYCYHFMNFVRIYPSGTKVLLTDGKTGTVLASQNGSSILPRIKLKNQKNVIQLPSDLSLTIKRVIGWDSREMKMQARQNWNDFIQNLIDGNPHQALKLLDELSDGKRVENVYTDVIERSINEIREGVPSSLFHLADLKIAINTAVMLLHWKMIKLSNHLNNTMGSVAIVNFDPVVDRLQLKMINDLFVINGWKTYFLGDTDTADLSMITDLIRRKGVHYLAGCFNSANQVFSIRHIFRTFLSQFPDLTLFVHGTNAHHINDPGSSQALVSSNISEFIANLRTLFPADDSATNTHD
ncbi:HD domain-containing protein [Sporolactobacillus sp. THM7-4]|nr:HD domain-containing protein [Sporolactobacillus sp. THM7-4]